RDTVYIYIEIISHLYILYSQISFCRVFLSVDFMIFTFGIMHIFAVSRVLGPKMIILRRMIKDVFFFLFLLAIWIVSYGVAKQSILVINETRLHWIFRNVLYEPYLALFGQIPTAVDGLNFDSTKCSENGTVPSLPKCVFNDGSGNALFPEWLTIILTCLYILFANILLLNLLIAMLSYTFGDVESHADQVWKFYCFGLIREYNERPSAPPPFILFSHLYLLFKNLFCRNDMNHLEEALCSPSENVCVSVYLSVCFLTVTHAPYGIL
uniref:Ion transport domain-containing protein n=1 Tax=Leptobrachium leishanense TaxID=445787 RepID=A0A8C5MRX2_9ANUR